MDSKFFLRGFIFLISSLLLSSCGTKTEKPVIIQPDKPIEKVIIKPTLSDLDAIAQLEAEKNWQSAFSAWKKTATDSNDGKSAEYYNKAALMLFYLGQVNIIPDFYKTIQFIKPTNIDEQHKDILLAVALFERGKSYQSLRKLPAIELIKNNDYFLIASNLKADATLAIGKPLKSVQIRLNRHKQLKDSEMIDHNISKIWAALDRASENSIVKSLSTLNDSDVRGWLELSLIARRSNLLPKVLIPWVEKWHKNYTQHSATEFANNLVLQSKNIYFSPSKITLILPFDGKLSNVSQAILNGFLYAYYQSNQQDVELNIVAINSKIPFLQQYQHAIDEGAELIVGPLNKAAIAELTTLADLPVHTLSLNYATAGETAPNLYQFGLRPEDEAIQVADYALLNQHYNAALLTPDNTRGQRMADAFKKQYIKFGGSVQSDVQYPSKTNDYSKAIKQLLNIDKSNSRHNLIQRIIGEKAEFKPRRRQDIDMIFLAANAQQARIIKPQLKFHYANDIQVYSTSHIVSSNSKKSTNTDRDLNGVLYVDMPWTLNASSFNETEDMNKYWPALSQSRSKLFALGVDAYRLIPQLNRLQNNSDERMNALTGELSISKEGIVKRALLLATYKKGKQVKIDTEYLQ